MENLYVLAIGIIVGIVMRRIGNWLGNSDIDVYEK